jgi:Antibiotic biosynthesis monooxygenase
MGESSGFLLGIAEVQKAICSQPDRQADVQGVLLLAPERKSAQFLSLQCWEDEMTAFNIVRFRVKPGHQEQFIAQHRGMNPGLKGFRGGSLVRTGENTFCFIGEWASYQKIVDARPLMSGILDAFRGHLEDQGGGLGVTDPVSGEVVVKLPATKPAAKKASAKKATKRKKRR